MTNGRVTSSSTARRRPPGASTPALPARLCYSFFVLTAQLLSCVWSRQVLAYSLVMASRSILLRSPRLSPIALEIWNRQPEAWRRRFWEDFSMRDNHPYRGEEDPDGIKNHSIRDEFSGR